MKSTIPLYLTTYILLLNIGSKTNMVEATEDGYPNPNPVPLIQVIPLPYDQASFQRNGVEVTRYHYGPTLDRPFLYPILGPSGRSLTRMGHPRDQESHSHHNSVWISHNDVNGVVFWGDQGKGKIRHKRIIEFEDGASEAYTVTENEWIDTDTDEVLLREIRRNAVRLLDNGEWLLMIYLEFRAPEDKEVTLGQTPFGMIGVRMAKTIGVHDGGGTIRNSEGQINEKEIFRNNAKWVDYSGLITNESVEGITLFDHPDNPSFPSPFHVRNDGWMGACLTHERALSVPSEEPLKLLYGLYIHSGMRSVDYLQRRWEEFVNVYSKRAGEWTRKHVGGS